MLLRHLENGASQGYFEDGARPMLYPLGKLDRVALEFDRRDLSQKFLQPPQPNGITPTLGCLVTAFKVFGPPRQLLLVRRTAGYEGDDKEAGLVCGWERMGFVDCNSEKWSSEEDHEDGERVNGDWNELAIDFVKRGIRAELSEKRFAFREYEWVEDEMANSWVGERVPDVCVVGLWAEGRIVMEKSERWRGICRLREKVAKEWIEREFEVKGREWEVGVDGSLYGNENIGRALEIARLFNV